jgi:hypothetical protein
MLPGGWETRAALTAAQCQAIEDPTYSPGGTYPELPPADAGVYQPLVYAVSGVRADDRPLLNSRAGGRARLAAPAAHALAADGAAPTDVLTGTSAGAAVTSAIAASVWGYRPQLTGPEVMDLVRRSGARLDVSADFCLGGRPCPRGPVASEVVRVNLCEAVRLACAGGLENCPHGAQMPECAPRPAYQGELPALTAEQLNAVAARATRAYSAAAITYALAPPRVCRSAELWTTLPRYPATPCPRRQFYGTANRPWTGPQPSSNACPVCTIEQRGAGNWSVTLSIDDEYTAAPLGSPVLRINDAYDIDLSGVGALGGGDVAVVDNLDLSTVGAIESAEISFRMASGGTSYSSASELIVQP